ncbi:MAG: 2-oxo acid dehydrogenase subunit E2 [Pirellulales bacterium]
MAVDFKLPNLGEGVESGEVLSLLVKEGDTISKDQNVVELETDKATVEVPCPHAGKVTKIHVKEGDSVPIGGLLISLETSDAGGKTEQAKSPPQAAQPKQEARQATEPARSAAKSRPDENAATSDDHRRPAAAPSHPATPSREERKPAASPVATATAPARSSSKPAPAPQVDRDDGNSGDSGDALVPAAGPAIRRFARELGVDLNRVRGTGPNGRILREDVVNAVRQANAGPIVTTAPPTPAARTPASAPAPASLPGEPGSDAYGPTRTERASKIRRTIADRMMQSWTTIPQLTNFDDADVTELERQRSSSKEDYAASGIKLTMLPFIIKAIAMSLRRHPVLNCSFDMEAGQIVYKDYVNIGVAVDTNRGLVVPVLQDVDRMTISDVARGLAELAEMARSNSFSLDDLRGGTFTISNLGAIGGSYSTPIINPGEVAILLAGRSRKMPVAIDDEIDIRLMLPLSLSYDHRIVDGASAARFLNDVIGYLESPTRLLLAP